MDGGRVKIAMQLGVMSILTLVTVAAFMHVVTMLLFRRLVVGDPKSGDEPRRITSEDTEEFRVPVRSSLDDAASMDDPENPTRIQRLAEFSGRVWSRINDLPNTLREGLIRDSGVTREVYVKCFHHRREVEQVLLLCNPSGETIETLSEKAVDLSKAIGFDSLVMFDYRPTGKSCKGLIAPDTKTMLEDTISVMQWLITVKGIEEYRISVAGISLGGLQAMRLAGRCRKIPRLLLINTFASFSCLLRSSASLLPGALRIGGTSAFLPDITRELRQLTTPLIAVVSVEEDERIPRQCTDEMLNAIRAGGVSRVLHLTMKGTHSEPKVDYNSLETIREFLELQEPNVSI